MVAEGIVGVLDRHGEHAPAGELIEQRPAAGGAAQLVAQRPRQAAQHAGVHEELAEVLAQPEQHVLGQVLPQQPTAHLGAAEHAAALVGRATARGQVEQLQPGGPALRAAGEHGEVARQHRVVVDVAEQLLDLPRAEAQVIRAELEQLARDAQPRQVDRRRHPAGDDDRQPWRRVVDQPAQRALGRRALEGVPIVDDQRRGGRRLGLQGRGDVLDGDPAAGEIRERRAQRRLEMTDERAFVRVPGLGAVPAHGNGRPGGKAGHERRLARSGRRNDEGQAMAPTRRRAAPRGVHGAGHPETAPGSSRAPPGARRHAQAAALLEPDVARLAIAALQPRNPRRRGLPMVHPGCRPGPPHRHIPGRSDGPGTRVLLLGPVRGLQGRIGDAERVDHVARSRRR